MQRRSSEARLAKKVERRGEGRREGPDAGQHARVLAKLADEVDGELRIVAEPPLIVPIDDLLAPGTSRDEVREVDALARTARTGARSRRHHHPARGVPAT